MAKPSGFETLEKSVQGLGTASKNAVKSFGTFLFGSAEKTGGASSGLVGKTGGVFGGIASWMAGSTGRVINGTTRVINWMPKTTVLLGIGAAGLAAKSYFDNKRAVADANYTLAQIEANRALSQMPSPYMNSVTPEESAALQAKMRESQAPAFQAAVGAQREQAQHQPGA